MSKKMNFNALVGELKRSKREGAKNWLRVITFLKKYDGTRLVVALRGAEVFIQEVLRK